MKREFLITWLSPGQCINQLVSPLTISGGPCAEIASGSPGRSALAIHVGPNGQICNPIRADLPRLGPVLANLLDVASFTSSRFAKTSDSIGKSARINSSVSSRFAETRLSFGKSARRDVCPTSSFARAVPQGVPRGVYTREPYRQGPLPV